MATRLTLHHFESDPSLQQRDGVNLAHTEINQLLGSGAYPELHVEFHDFARLMTDRDYAVKTLGSVDCVLCNVGPHAHYYHYLRDRLGLDFRIVRDVKTALWSGYLLQESLCEPYLRAGDALLATSHYSRVLTQHLFPHLRGSPIHLFEPVLAAPTAPSLPKGGPRLNGHMTTLGYVGRLSEDKNFPQAVDLLIALDREEPGRYRLMAVGAVHSASCAPDIVAQRIRAATGRDDLFVYLPPVGHDRVMALLAQFDYFLFFSTSNLEVLGRVLVEAAHAGIPVLAANHAAAPELLAPASLLEVKYEFEQEFHSHFDAPLGSIDVAAAAEKICRRAIPHAPPRPTMNRPETLLSVLTARTPEWAAGTEPSLPPAQTRFLKQLRWGGLPRFSSRHQAAATIEPLADWFSALNTRAGGDFEWRLQELERRSRFKERTRRFIATSMTTRCDFTNLGGIDIELCNIAGYHPRFKLSAPSAEHTHPTVPELKGNTEAARARYHW